MPVPDHRLGVLRDLAAAAIFGFVSRSKRTGGCACSKCAMLKAQRVVMREARAPGAGEFDDCFEWMGDYDFDDGPDSSCDCPSCEEYFGGPTFVPDHAPLRVTLLEAARLK